MLACKSNKGCKGYLPVVVVVGASVVVVVSAIFGKIIRLYSTIILVSIYPTRLEPTDPRI